MVINIELKPDLDTRLRSLAQAQGVSVAAYITRLIEEVVPVARNREAMELLESWNQEDSTEDLHELEIRQGDWESLKEALNEHHTSDRVLFP